jgi:hypothetical protein
LNKKFGISLGAWVAAGCIVGVGGFIATSSVRSQQSPTDPTINRTTAPTNDQSKAIEALSQHVDFNVVRPSVGNGFKLTGAEAFNGDGTLSRSRLVFETADSTQPSRIDVVQFDIRLIHAANDAATDVEPPLPGWDLKVDRNPDQDVYTLRSSTQTFVITIEGSIVADASITGPLFASLVR